MIANVGSGQKVGLLLVLTILPLLCMFISYKLYIKHYRLDEDEYKRICKTLEQRNAEKSH